MRKVWKYGVLLAFILLMVTVVGFGLADDSDQSDGIFSRIVQVPEFPSVFLPITLITGFLCGVAALRRAGEP